MIQVPLPTTISGSARTPKLQQHTLNLIYSQGALLSRPACERVYSVPIGQPRGQFVYDGELYSLWRSTLYRGISTLTPVGTINGSGKISTAEGFNGVAIATGANNYFFNGALSVLNDPDLPACSDVSRVDSRFIWTPSNGDPLFYSDVNQAGVIDALSFFDAETLPDKNKATANIRNDLFVFGEESIERFRNIGGQAAPFVRVNNSINSVGFVGGLIETRESFMFLGKDKDGGNQFYAHANGTAIPISNDSINEQISNDFTQEELRQCEGQRFNWHGVDCYVFSLPGRDYVFTGGSPSNWGYFSEGTDGVNIIKDWGFRSSKFFDNDWYVEREDGLYKFTHGDSDSTGYFTRGIKTFIRSGGEIQQTLAQVEVSLAQFVGCAGEGSVGLSLSRDGVTWSDAFFRNTGGEYDNRLIWAPLGGLGQYEGYIGLQLYANSDTPFHIDNVVIF